MQLILKLVMLLTFVVIAQGQGKTIGQTKQKVVTPWNRFGKPFHCFYQNSFYDTRPYASIYSFFTARDTMDCCYQDNTRDMCCMFSYLEFGQYRYECRCHPSFICDARMHCPAPRPPTLPPTTPTTPTTPQPTPKALLCPEYARELGSRALNGVAVDDECRYKGIAKILIDQSSNSNVLCHAVYAKAKVNGVMRDVFVTVDHCKDNLVKILSSNQITFTLMYGDRAINLDDRNFDFKTGSNGEAYLIPKVAIPDERPCQNYACPYSNSMPPVDSLTDCHFVSYGPINANLDLKGLHKVSVKLTPEGCVGQKKRIQVKDAKCFATTSGSNISCQGDLGAPVYCTAPTTGESIFIGNAALQDCFRDKDVLVIPMPS